jgi:hypothetical protein
MVGSLPVLNNLLKMGRAIAEKKDQEGLSE